MTVFKLENDLRTWVRQEAGNVPLWIEPGMGSTIGLPDCCIPFGGDGQVCWIELKLGELKKGGLVFEVRAAQRTVINQLLCENQCVAFMVGIKGTGVVIVMRPHPQAMAGRVESLNSAVDERWLMVVGQPPSMPIDGRLGRVELACRMAVRGCYPTEVN